MKIAVTYENGAVFQHFGPCKNFKFYEVEGNEIKDARIISALGSGHGALTGFLKLNGADVLICGGIGGGARTALSQAGIELYPGVTGSADESVIAFLNGKLNYNPDTLCNHHHEGEHHCGGHTCGEDKHGCSGNN